MLLRSRLLLLCTGLALAACQTETNGDPANCVGKCDGQSEGLGPLMPAAPEGRGSISIVREGQGWLFEVTGAKGTALLESQTYADRVGAAAGALSAEENGVLPERFAVRSVGGGFQFVLEAGNGVELAASQVFASEADAQTAMQDARDVIASVVQVKAAQTGGAGFQLTRDGSAWRFSLRDADGKPVLASQSYSRRHDALTGIESVRNNGKNPVRYTVLDAPPRFILKAGNGQEIATSAASFSTRDDATAAAAATQALLVSERVASPY